MNWPNDADGDVFRRLQSTGFDFYKEVYIDFNIDFDHWPLLPEEVKKINSLYPGCKYYEPKEEGIKSANQIGYAQFQVLTKLTYALVMEMQIKVTKEMKGFGGYCESWGVLQE